MWRGCSSDIIRYWVIVCDCFILFHIVSLFGLFRFFEYLGIIGNIMDYHGISGMTRDD